VHLFDILNRIDGLSQWSKRGAEARPPVLTTLHLEMRRRLAAADHAEALVRALHDKSWSGAGTSRKGCRGSLHCGTSHPPESPTTTVGLETSPIRTLTFAMLVCNLAEHTTMAIRY
jgi:hypothetical protein